MEGNHTHPEELLSQLGWLQGLVRGLVSDPGMADDVVQETWLATLSRLGRGGGLTRPWMARVARNSSRQLYRRDVRRRWREQEVARPESILPDAHDRRRQELLGALGGVGR